MRKYFLLVFSIVFMACGSLYLAACHSGGSGAAGTAVSGAGVNTFSRGVVAGTGNTMSVNGVEFNTDNANVLVNGDSGTKDEIKMGQVVDIRGTSSGTEGTGSDVLFSNQMTGPVSGVTTEFSSGVLSSATMTVFSQTITVDGNTITEPADLDLSSLQTGSIVEVSGMPDGAGNIAATFIESKPTASTFNIRGIVSNAAGSAFTLTPGPNGNPLEVSLGAGAQLPANLQDGAFVNVRINPAAFTDLQANSIPAQSISIENPQMPAEGDLVFLDGFAMNISGNSFTIDGMPVSAGTQNVPSPGSRVAVHGTFTGGVLVADLIVPAGVANLTIGAITSVSSTTAGAWTGGETGGSAGATVVVNGRTFDISSAKIKMNGLPASVADLLPGKVVIVKSPMVMFMQEETGAGVGTGGTGTTGNGSSGVPVPLTGWFGSDDAESGAGGTGTGITGAETGGGLRAARAIALWIVDNIHGPISQAPTSLSTGTTGTKGGLVSTGSFSIFNQTIVMSNITRFEPAGLGTTGLSSVTTGTVLEVSGLPDGAGSLFATLIKSDPTATEYHVRGLVSAVTGSPATSFTLTPVPEGTPLSISLASGATTSAGFAEGATVNVRIDPATFTPGATALAAQAVNLVKEPIPLENTVISVEGIVSNLSGNTFTVNGITVNAGSLSTTELQNGKILVRVRGTVSGGQLRANQIQKL